MNPLVELDVALDAPHPYCYQAEADEWGLSLIGSRRSWAVLSQCGTYRYALGRTWNDLGPTLIFLMLNPSTADHAADDPTIRKCVGFARRERCGGIAVVNAFAMRATDPRELYDAIRVGKDAVGPHNHEAIRIVVGGVLLGKLVLATGRPKWVALRSPIKMAHAEAMCWRLAWCLGVNSDGSPRHPLYLRADTPLVPIGDARSRLS